MQTIPRVPSPILISLICIANWSQNPINELDLILMPSKSFSWDVAITIAAADVKPAETGPDIKSIKNPRKRTSRYDQLKLNTFLNLCPCALTYPTAQNP